ncbi:MAG: HIT domain-containing protein [Candidatus Magasanikbacteria bacterium]|nr:HIT domain-containing protein [Candidatus Magasanikbacteria bacterium]
MEECIFCKIINKEIPAHIIYEDENNLAFLDVNPRCKGHTVVIPKEHAKNPFGLSDESLKLLFVATKKTMQRIDEKLKPDGYNVGWNQNSAGGQVVPHMHVHILPRWRDDGGGNMHSIVNHPGDETVEEVAKYFNAQ